jgi:CubicO group peptidase (beta-lactamase class C family)
MTPSAELVALLERRLVDRGVGYAAFRVDGSRVEVGVAGRGRRNPPEPLSADALLEIGSVTKTFTALLLAEAVVRKELHLDGPVEEALPGGLRLRDAQGEPIRWIDLATHRSGLPRLPTNGAPRDPADPYADYDEARLLDYLRQVRIEVPRGGTRVYSNLGFGLLGYALGRAAGTDHERLLHTRVLTPLGLEDARLLRTGASTPPRLVEGHDAEGKPVPHWHWDVMAPAGGLLMTAAGLARYAQAALGVVDNPLSRAFALTLETHAPASASQPASGLAWLLGPLNGRTVANHDGGTYGFSSSLWLDPARRRAAGVLANAFVEVQDIGLHLLEPAVPMQDLSSLRQPAVTLTPAQLEPLVGRYALNAQFKITVSLADGRLMAQATGQGTFELHASSPRRFFARITPLSVEFMPDEGRPEALVLTQGGRTTRFVREP